MSELYLAKARREISKYYQNTNISHLDFNIRDIQNYTSKFYDLKPICFALGISEYNDNGTYSIDLTKIPRQPLEIIIATKMDGLLNSIELIGTTNSLKYCMCVYPSWNLIRTMIYFDINIDILETLAVQYHEYIYFHQQAAFFSFVRDFTIKTRYSEIIVKKASSSYLELPMSLSYNNIIEGMKKRNVCFYLTDMLGVKLSLLGDHQNDKFVISKYSKRIYIDYLVDNDIIITDRIFINNDWLDNPVMVEYIMEKIKDKYSQEIISSCHLVNSHQYNINVINAFKYCIDVTGLHANSSPLTRSSEIIQRITNRLSFTDVRHIYISNFDEISKFYTGCFQLIWDPSFDEKNHSPITSHKYASDIMDDYIMLLEHDEELTRNKLIEFSKKGDICRLIANLISGNLTKTTKKAQ